MSYTAAENARRLRLHLERMTEGRDGWWEACAEYRKQSDAEAWLTLERGLRAGAFDADTVRAVVWHADRDLSRKSRRKIGRRYGLTFATHLSNMSWLEDGRLGAVGRDLWGLLNGEMRLEEVLARRHDLPSFVFVTLVGFLREPDRFLPWIAAVHDSVATLSGGLRTRVPDVGRYLEFVVRTQALVAPVEVEPCMFDLLLYELRGPTTDTRSRRVAEQAEGFGSPIPHTVDAERRFPLATDVDLTRTVEGYQGLHRASAGLYQKFATEAAGCTRCRVETNIAEHQQPIPCLVGIPPVDEPLDEAVARLRRLGNSLDLHRRPDGSLKFQPDDPIAVSRIRGHLSEQDAQGLFVGQCGWSDLSARVRGSSMEEGCRLMVLGNDWYPLTRCSNFLSERIGLDGTLTRFLRGLQNAEGEGGATSKPTAEALFHFIRTERVYFANTLSCFRTGWATTGTTNLSRRSFEHCASHVASHILAVKPAVLVTFGGNSCAAVSRLVKAVDPDGADILVSLRCADRNVSLGAAMRAFYQETEQPAGLRVTLREHEMRFVPLYHPSYFHLNRYPEDYQALRRAMKQASEA